MEPVGSDPDTAHRYRVMRPLVRSLMGYLMPGGMFYDEMFSEE